MISFALPWLLAALVMPAIAAFLAWHALRARREVARLLGGPPGLRTRATVFRAALAGLVVMAMVLAVLAAARPQSGLGVSPVAQRGIDLVIALDVSRSMEAQDIQPSRSQAAASGIQELLTHLVGSRVGLVTFAGGAFTRSPLTSDLDAVASLVARSQGEAPLVSPGTDLKAALDESFEVLDVTDAAATQAIIVVSDGEDLGSEFDEAVRAAARNGIRIYTVFVGTQGAVPLPEERGQTDLSEANPALLASIAATTGGATRGVERIPGFAVDFRRLQQTTFEEVPQTQPAEQFAWFAGAAAGLLLLTMLTSEGGRARVPRLRRGLITSVVALLSAGFLVGCGSAAWQQVERGHAAYEQGYYDVALEAYRAAAEERPEDPLVAYNIAATLLAQGRYLDAEQAAAEARQLASEPVELQTAVMAWHISGNASFLRQDFTSAHDAYRSALRLDPGAQDLKANLELVLAMIQPPPPDPPPEGSQGGDDEGEGGS
ncbi:MAG: VWA domain-containing protein, partial [Chloroflexi bacterium]|nr:VWA domain-containing protein [Chloroflexota bacterium]